MAIKLHTFQIGTPPAKNAGLRIGTVRYLPRGVKKEDYTAQNMFDVWFPTVAPSQKLLRWLKDQTKKKGYSNDIWNQFLNKYERELMGHSDGRQAVQLLAELSKRTAISVGCYCEHDEQCHRSRLREVIIRVAEKGLP